MSSTKSFISLQNKYDRVVLLVDMDCFYCQVEEKLDPRLAGKAIAVVQYNAWRGGGIIAVNYAARAQGVTRHMRGDEAKKQCPDIVLAKVPNVREKADLTKYREAGKEVAGVLQKYTQLLERASIDEAYLDITESVDKRLEEMTAESFKFEPDKYVNTYAVGYGAIGDYIAEVNQKISSPCPDDNSYHAAFSVEDLPAVRKSDIKLLIGASIANEIRAAVKELTKYECSAGIAHNKIMAKLACGMNKPNKQTILPLSQLPIYFETLPVNKIKGLGAKFGEEICENLGIKYLAELSRFTESELQRKFDEKNGTWLYYISRGIDLEAVTPRFYSKSIGCCKKFPGRNMITGLNTLQHWLNELANEISDRVEKDLEENNRKAKQMVVSYIQEFNGEDVSSSRSAPLQSYDKETLAKTSLDVIKANTKIFFCSGSDSVLNNPIKFLGISVGKFETITQSQNKLLDMFANQEKKKKKQENEDFAGLNGDKREEDATKAQQDGQKNQDTTSDDARDNPSNEKRGFFAKFMTRYMQKKEAKTRRSSTSSFEDIDSPCQGRQEEEKEDEVVSINKKKRKISEIFSFSDKTLVEPSSSTAATDYRSEYVELAVPEIRNELFIECETCGAKILSDEISLQTHRDHHFAEQLTQQQRDEYRQEFKKKINQNAISEINQKKSKKPPASIKNCDIKKYFKPENTLQSESSLPLAANARAAQPNTVLCSECHQYIKEVDMLEHSDFHVAKRLQESLN